MKKVLMLVLAALSFNVCAEEVVSFDCTLENGHDITVYYEPERDTFRFYSVDHGGRVLVNVEKPSTRMGTAVTQESGLPLSSREIYIVEGDFVYDVTLSKLKNKTVGHFQIMEAGVETSYQTCKPDTLYTTFDKTEQFASMTLVD